MAKKREIGKRRILIYYSLAIVFPCIILGILAFRGILNDQALVERENRRNLMEASGKIADNTLSSIDLLEQELTFILNEKANASRNPSNDSSILSFQEKYGVIKQICLQHEDGRTFCQSNKLLYLPLEMIDAEPVVLSIQVSSLINNGWKYEFQDKNFDKAISYYQNSLDKPWKAGDKASILNILARLYKKNEEYPLALATYNTIYQDYPQTYILNNIPLGLVSLREKLKIYALKNDKEGIINTTSLITKHLVQSKSTITESHFENTRSDVYNALKKLDTIPRSISADLKDLQTEKRETEYVINLIESTNENYLKGKSPRSYFSVRGIDYYLAKIPQEDKNWILFYDIDKMLDSLIIPQLKLERTIEKTNWLIKGSQDSILRSYGKTNTAEIPLSFTFPSTLPDWTIEYFPTHKNLVSSFLTLGGGLYLYILLFILIFLAFGLMFTLYSINQELRLSKMKSNFISTVSHEFKSPLTSIRQMAEMLESERVPNKDRKKAYYKNILNQSERLTHLVENILDFARMEEGRKRYQFQKNNIVETIEKTINDFRFQVENNGFEIRFEAERSIPAIIFDKDSIEQVIHNLLDNAVKYSGTSKVIKVKIKNEVDFINISVKDFGIGIPQEEQEKVFERFYRVGDVLTHSVKGTGIGLTIVKQIVDKHNGKISLDSQVNKGSTFTIVLPKLKFRNHEKNSDRRR